jgi:hypothetical protein
LEAVADVVGVATDEPAGSETLASRLRESSRHRALTDAPLPRGAVRIGGAVDAKTAAGLPSAEGAPRAAGRSAARDAAGVAIAQATALRLIQRVASALGRGIVDVYCQGENADGHREGG